MFWIGFGIGAMIGSILGVMCIALVVANHTNERDDEEQVMYLINQKDRNEF